MRIFPSAQRYAGAILAFAALSFASGPAMAASLLKATVSGVITSAVADLTFGTSNLVGKSYEVSYYYDPGRGAVALYNPGGGRFDKTQAGNNADSPLRYAELTINGHTDRLFDNLAGIFSQIARVNYPGSSSQGLFDAQGGGPYALNPTSYDYQQFGSSFVGAPGISPDFSDPYSGPVTSGASGFLRQVQNAGRGYDVAYNISGTVTGVRIGAIPEPSAWALMILGFGGAGAMLRRRRDRNLVSA